MADQNAMDAWQKRHPFLAGLLGWSIIGAFGGVIMASAHTTPSAPDAPPTISDMARHCGSAWDGTFLQAVDKFKNQLRDPDSFQAIKTHYDTTANDTHKVVFVMDYRAKNGFGGMNVGRAVGIIDLTTCNVSEVGAWD